MDSYGNERSTKHNLPRLKVDIDGNKIPVSISREPEILAKNKLNSNIPKFRLFKKWMNLNYNILIKHWNKEITDEELENSLKKI